MRRYNLIKKVIDKDTTNETLFCTTEDPYRVQVELFPSKLYSDSETRMLDEAYDVSTCPINFVSSSLGQVELEIAAARFLDFSRFEKKFVGLQKNELLPYLLRHNVSEGDLHSIHNLLRLIQIGEHEILFPTAELLDNQKVQKK